MFKVAELTLGPGGIKGGVGVKAKKKKKQKPVGGTIVPVGGETPLGMYSGQSGQLIKAAPREYAVAKRNTAGKMQYTPAFRVTSDGEVQRSKGSTIDTNTYRYKGLNSITETPRMSASILQQQQEKQDEPDFLGSIWGQFTNRVSENTPLRWAWSTFSTITGAAAETLTKIGDLYNERIQNPVDHFVAAGSTFLNPRSEGLGDWSKSWEGTYGLDAMQAATQNPLNPLSWASESNRPWNPVVSTELGDTRGLTPEQKAQAEADTKARQDKSMTGLDPAKHDDHEAIRQWSENTLLGRYSTFANSVGYALGADPGWFVGKGAKAAKGAAQGAHWLEKLGPKGFASLVDKSAEALRAGDDAPRGIIKLDGLDDLSRKAGEKLDDTLAKQTAGNSVSLGGEALNPAQARRQAKADRAAARMQKSMEKTIKFFATTDDAGTIANHWMIKQSTYAEALSGILADAKSTDDVAVALKAFAQDDATMAHLEESNKWLADTIQNMHNHSQWLGEFRGGKYTQLNPTDAGSKLKQFNNIEEESAWVNGYLESLRSQSDYINKLLSPDVSGSILPNRALGTKGMTGNAWQEQRRINKAVSQGDIQWDTQVFQKNPFAIPVRVVRWAGRQRPNNWVQFAGVSDVNSAGPAMKAWLNSADSKIIDTDMKKQLFNRFAEASGKGDDVMLETLNGIEQDVLMQYAIHHGKRVGVVPEQIDINTFKTLRPLKDKTPKSAPEGPQPVSELEKAKQVVRANETYAYDSARRIDDAELPTNSISDQLEGVDPRKPAWAWKKTDENVGAKKVYETLSEQRKAEIDDVEKGNRILADWADAVVAWQRKRDHSMKMLDDRRGYYVDNDGSLSVIPGYEAQLAGARPMMDLNRFGHVAAGTTNRLSVRTKETLSVLNSGFQQLYRPTVLLGPKYTLRNNFEAQLRSLALVGAATYDPNTIRAMGANAAARGKKLDLALTGRGRKATERMEKAVREDLYGEQGLVTMRDALQADLDSLGHWMDQEDQSTYQMILDGINAKYGSVAGAQQAVADLSTQEAVKLSKLDTVAARHETMNTERKRAGSYDFSVGANQGESVTAPGMLNKGPNNPIPGEAMLANLSADETASMIFTLRHDARMKAFRKALYNDNTLVTADRPEYWNALAKFANQTLMNSKLAELRLTGASDADFIKFIHSTEGEGVRRLANQLGKNLHSNQDLIDWFHSGADTLRRYFPDAEITSKILNGKAVSPEELRTRLGHLAEQGEMPAVNGAEIVSEHGVPQGRSAWEMFRAASQAGFVALGSVPESNLARYPLGTAFYKKHLTSLVQFHGTDFAERHMDKLVRQAQRAALRDVKEGQYTVERYSNLAAALEPAAPFFQAKLNSMRVWSTLVANDPSILARAQQLWQLTDRTFTVPTGEIVNADVPGWSQLMDATGMSDLPEQEQTKFDVNNIWSILLSNNPQIEKASNEFEGKGAFEQASAISYIIGQFAPQFGGPWVAPAASEIYKATAAANDPNFFQKLAAATAGYLSPYGASNSFLSLETLAPANVKSIERWVSAQKSDAFSATAMAIYVDEMVRYNKRGAPDGEMPTFDQAVEKAKALYATDLFYQLTSPFGGFEHVNENNPIRDEIKALYDQGKTGAEVREIVYTKFGMDYAPLMLPSQDKFGHVPATMKAVKWLAANRDTVSRYLLGADGKVTDPETASYRMDQLRKLVPELQSDGSYDAKAASLLRTMDIPGMSDRQYYDKFIDPAATLIKQRQVQAGWLAFRQMDAAFDKRKAEIQAKYPNMNVKGSSDKKKFWREFNALQDARDATVNDMTAQFPQWKDESGFMSDSTAKQSMALGVLAQMRSDKKLYAKLYADNPEYFDTVDAFIDFRTRKMQDIAMAGSTRYKYDKEPAAAVKEERAKYEWGVKKLKAMNTQFADMFDSFFTPELYFERGPKVPTPDVWIPRAYTDVETKKRKKKGTGNVLSLK